MIKNEILKTIVCDRTLHDKIYKSLDIRQETIRQSFYRCITRGKPSGQSHDEKVIKIIKRHLKIKDSQLYDN